MGILQWINDFVWGLPALVLILGVGIYITLGSGFAQVRWFPKAIKEFVGSLYKKNTSQGVSTYRAMCTALAATVGTGNLAGVAGAIAIGGPGAVFWMWIAGVIGMATKFAEACLAVKYRQRGSDGQYLAGPMYMICNGLGKSWKWMAAVYSFFGVVAAFGVGNITQINTMIASMEQLMNGTQSKWVFLVAPVLGIVLAVLFYLLLKSGAGRIGAAAELLVPFASVMYIGLGFAVLVIRSEFIIPAIQTIIKGAFSPEAVTGGTVGSWFVALRIGASRGVFTNEAGMGTAAIAHGGAQVSNPVRQGLMGIVEVFLDTIVICTVTALVILCSGIALPYGTDPGIQLTCRAFAAVLGNWVQIPLTCAICLFAIATVLGWGLYGGRCAQYLFGEGSWDKFVYLQCGMVIVGALMETGTVWILADIVNGLMVIPNLIALLFLSPVLFKMIKGTDKASVPMRSKRHNSSVQKLLQA